FRNSLGFRSVLYLLWGMAQATRDLTEHLRLSDMEAKSFRPRVTVRNSRARSTRGRATAALGDDALLVTSIRSAAGNPLPDSARRVVRHVLLLLCLSKRIWDVMEPRAPQ